MAFHGMPQGTFPCSGMIPFGPGRCRTEHAPGESLVNVAVTLLVSLGSNRSSVPERTFAAPMAVPDELMSTPLRMAEPLDDAGSRATRVALGRAAPSA